MGGQPCPPDPAGKERPTPPHTHTQCSPGMCSPSPPRQVPTSQMLQTQQRCPKGSRSTLASAHEIFAHAWVAWGPPLLSPFPSPMPRVSLSGAPKFRGDTPGGASPFLEDRRVILARDESLCPNRTGTAVPPLCVIACPPHLHVVAPQHHPPSSSFILAPSPPLPPSLDTPQPGWVPIAEGG